MDLKKAFLYGYIQRRVYIELPSEAIERGDGEMVGWADDAMMR